MLFVKQKTENIGETGGRPGETWGRDRNTARLALGEGLAVSAFPLSVPV